MCHPGNTVVQVHIEADTQDRSLIRVGGQSFIWVGPSARDTLIRPLRISDWGLEFAYGAHCPAGIFLVPPKYYTVFHFVW